MIQLTASLNTSTTNAKPCVSAYLPETNPRGIGVIVFPGGGYSHLAEHEGKGYATFLQENGIAAFVVNYRLATDGYMHPAMLEDALATIETIRQQADSFGIHPQRLGVMGSSAGGHLAAQALVSYKRYESTVSLKASFGILCYPVIKMPSIMTDDNPRAYLSDMVTSFADEQPLQEQVTDSTSPCFIWHTVEDATVPVENSFSFAQALRKKNRPFELHIYEKGRHGLGLNTNFTWASDCLRWLYEKFPRGGKL